MKETTVNIEEMISNINGNLHRGPTHELKNGLEGLKIIKQKATDEEHKKVLQRLINGLEKELIKRN